MKPLKLLIMAIAAMVYIIPCFAIAAYSVIHYFIFDTDFTQNKVIVKLMSPLNKLEKWTNQ